MEIHPSLTPILDAELRAGNTIDRITSDRPPWRRAVYLTKSFHDAYFSTRRLPGVKRGYPLDSNSALNNEWYEFEGEAIFAPMPAQQRYAECYQRAEREGRALPMSEWMAEATERTAERGSERAKSGLYGEAARMADAIEAEMRRVGLWQDRPLPPEAYQFERAFAGDSMSYDQWLQFIMLPRVRQIIAERGQFPPASSTAAQAVREFDGRDDCNRLISLLSEFDGLFEAVDPMAGVPNRFGLRYFSFRIALFLSMLAWGVASVWLSGPISQRFKGAFHPSLTQRLTLVPEGRFFGDVTIDLSADVTSADALAPKTLTLNMSHKIGAGGFRARVLEIDLAGGVCRVLSLPREPDQPWSPTALEAWLQEEWRRDDRDASSAAFRRELEMMQQWTQKLSGVQSKSELKDVIEFVSSGAGYKLRGSTAFEAPAHTPAWLENTTACVLAFLGGVPIALSLVRWYRRPVYAS